ncbi:MAG: hypothetical protein HQK83_04170 [Fibrobacteria bacterium]|nr:hypothetical protein [Fibrobacteria bacterium]
MYKLITTLTWLLCLTLSLSASEPDKGYSIAGTAELGFLGVASHKVQFSNDNTYFNYAEDGGQDILFPFGRVSLDVKFKSKHHLVFLYQPLSLVTRETLSKDLMVDDIRFLQGTPMEFRYDFPFWRLSYLYDFSKNPQRELAFGLSFQIRNARIEFQSLDSEQFRSTRDIGPVPILKTRLKQEFSNGLWTGLEADGFYAPVSYINGSENEVIGAILDASVRTGLKLKHGDIFFNLRYLGGGAVGTSSDTKGAGDGYVRNWLHFYTVSIGYTHPLF